MSYKKPLRAASNKIIGTTGLSFILNGNELQTTMVANPQALKNSENDTKTLFYSNLENKYDLSIRQKECLYYLTKGLPLKQIARKLHLSVRTIEHHIESAKIKMNCFSRIDLIEKLLAI